jgi:hypothetical protein
MMEHAHVVLSALAAAALCGPCSAESNLQQFTGTWVLRYQSHNFLVFALRLDHDAIAGTLALPEHFSFDQDGDFSHISAQQRQAAASDLAVVDGQLEFSVRHGSDLDRYALKLLDREHALLRAANLPFPMPPWRLQRVRGSADVKVWKDWLDPDQKPASQEIAALQTELKRMADEDQAVRNSNPISERRMQEIDQANLPLILRIHRKYGWPKASLVGKETAGRFWLLVQHQELNLQRKLLPEMRRAVAKGEASQRNYVFLYDRVMKREGKRQHWGTQTTCVDGKAVLDPVDDPAGLEARRKDLYFPPMEEYLKSLNASCENMLHDLGPGGDTRVPH